MLPDRSFSARRRVVIRNPEITKNTRTPRAANETRTRVGSGMSPGWLARCANRTSTIDMARRPSREGSRDVRFASLIGPMARQLVRALVPASSHQGQDLIGGHRGDDEGSADVDQDGHHDLGHENHAREPDSRV